MGAPTVTWQAQTDSPAGDGKKAVVTEPIEPTDGFDAAQFWEAFLKTCKERKKMPGETDYSVTENPDGTLTAVSTCDRAGQSISTYTHIVVDRENNRSMMKAYPTDPKMEDGNLESVSHLNLYTEPLRLEWYVEEQAGRKSNETLVPRLTKLLERMGASGEIQTNQPSLLKKNEGTDKLSVIVGPIKGPVNGQNFLEWTKTDLESLGAKLQDGAYVMEIKGPAATTMAKITLNEERNLVIMEDYGPNKQFAPHALRSTTYTKVVRNPFRLEVFRQNRQRRLTGEGQKAAVTELADRIFSNLA